MLDGVLSQSSSTCCCSPQGGAATVGNAIEKEENFQADATEVQFLKGPEDA